MNLGSLEDRKSLIPTGYRGTASPLSDPKFSHLLFVAEVGVFLHSNSYWICSGQCGSRTHFLPIFPPSTGVLISPYPDQEGNKLQRQNILISIYPICNHNWRNISTIYIHNKTSIKRNILIIKKIYREVDRAKDLSAPLYVFLVSYFQQEQEIVLFSESWIHTASNSMGSGTLPWA